MRDIHYCQSYEALHHHIGHTLELIDVWDWSTNRETGLELRCTDCQESEPLFEMDRSDI